MATTATAVQTQAAPAAQDEKENKVKITHRVLSELHAQQDKGRLDLPPNYSVANAMNSAWLVLQDTVNKNGKPVLATCTQTSIVNALRDMAYAGLNPSKDQCYFIANGNELRMQPSYFGNMMIAKRVDPTIKEINAQVIYEGDKVVTSINSGKTRVVVHEHQWGTEDPKKIIGAYCTIVRSDGSEESTILPMSEIRIKWEFGPTHGNSPAHKKAPGEMAKRTVINLATKPIIKSSNDASLLREVFMRAEMNEARAQAEETAKARTNVVDVDFTPVQETAAETVAAKPAPQPEPEPVPNPEPTTQPSAARTDAAYEDAANAAFSYMDTNELRQPEPEPINLDSMTVDPKTGEIIEEDGPGF